MTWTARFLALGVCLGLTLFLTTGCSPKVEKKDDKLADKEDHEHEIGKILGGDLFPLDKKNHEYHAEFVHDDEEKKITIIVVGGDDALDKSIPLETETLTIRFKKPDTKELKLKKEERQGIGKDKEAKYTAYVLTDEVFATEEFEFELQVPIKGKDYFLTIKEHSH